LGYHPVHLGEKLDSKYIVLKKLGWGHFSTVWLSFNIEDRKLYALKVMRSNPRYEKVGFDEYELNQIIKDNQTNPVWINEMNCDTYCLQMYDWFFHHGFNGKHFVMVFEVLGKNLLNLIKRYGN
jgi:serine/threonine-protein kinase SRPK3